MLTSRDGSNRGRAVWIVAAIAFAIPLSLFAVQGLEIQPAETHRLAETDPSRRLTDWHHEQFTRTDTLLVTWPGSTSDDPRIAPFTEALLGRMDADGVRRGGAPEVAAVTTPADLLQQMSAQGIETDAAVQRLTGTFIGTGGLKIKLTDAGREAQAATTERLIRAVRSSLGLELETRGPAETWTADAGADAAATPAPIAIREHDLEITWRGFHPQAAIAVQVRSLVLALTDFPTADEPDGRKLVADCFIAPGTPVGISVALSDAGSADVAAAVRAIDRAAAAAELPAVHIVGEPLARAEEIRATTGTLWNAAAPALRLHNRSLPLFIALTVAVLALCVLRNVHTSVLVVGLSLTAALLTAGMLRMSGPLVDPLLVALPLWAGLLMLSGGMQITGRRRSDEAAAAAGDVSAVRYATIVAALILLPLMISSTPPVRQFGAYGAASVIVVMLLSVFALPALLPSSRTDRSPHRVDGGNWTTIADLVTRRPRLTTVLCGLLLFVGAAGAGRMRIETSDVRTLPADSRLTDAAQFVEDNLTGTAPLDVVVRFSAESRNETRFLERAEIVRAVELTVQQHPAIVGTLSLADMLPVSEIPAADAPTRQRVMFNRKSNEAEEQVRSGGIPGADGLLQTADRVRDWQTVGDERLTRVDDELWRISTRALLPAGLDVQAAALEIDATVKQVLRQHPGADHVLAGASIHADATRRAMLKSFAKTTGLACFVLFVSLIWLLRTPSAILVGWLVNVLPIAGVMGIASLRGVRIDVGVMVAVLLALALGAHAGVQFLHRFRSAIEDGAMHAAAARTALAECGPGFWRFSIVAIGALLALRSAEISTVSRFGGLLAAMIAASQLSIVVLLPSLLAGRCGLWLQRSLRPTPPTAMHDEHPSPHVRFEPAARDIVRHTV